jgi:valyl-tRNA synthetase
MDKYEFALVGNELYAFVWDDFCSWYVEMCKTSLNGEDAAARKAAQSTLYTVLLDIVRLLHPFMPFVTEEIYQALPHEKPSICIESWPRQISGVPAELPEQTERLIAIIKAVRQIKVDNNLKPGAPLSILVKDSSGRIRKAEPGISAMLMKMTKTEWKEELEGDLATMPISGGSISIPSSMLQNKEEERKKLTAEKERLDKEIARSRGILSNAGFLAKAPKQKIDAEQQKLEDYQKQQAVVTARLDALN